MAQCAKCGKELDAEAKFCLICGTPVEDDVEAVDSPDPFKTVVKDGSAYGVVNLEQLPEGHLIDDRYEVKAKLGQGGFGAVYRVFDRKMECEKALKVLPEAVASDLEAMGSIRREAVTMARLNHPNIVRIFEFQDKGAIKYIDMELVEGRSLTELKLEAPDKRLDENAAAGFAVGIAKGLAYAHGQGVIHKDIKPQNILITSDGTPKITDFGISETMKSSMSRIANSSSSGTLVYMSPEQIRGKDVGRESDIYSFGALLYELLAGHPPFYKGAIEHQILNEPVEKIEGVSDALNRIVLRCLEKAYLNRYRRVEEVQEALKGEVASRPEQPASRESTPLPKETVATGGTLALRWAVGCLVVVLIGFVTKVYWEDITAREPVIGQTTPAALKGPAKTITNSLGMEFVFIKPGTFLMGSPGSEPDRGSNEVLHRVVLTQGYYLQATEVTQGQWNAVMGNNPSYFKNCGDDCPVEQVSWEDAQEFIRKLNAREGENRYRLPTEAEWEYACRAGSTTALYTGDLVIKGVNNGPALEPIAWYGGDSCVDYEGGWDSSGWTGKQVSCSRSGTHPVARKSPNQWGLYDMYGNVWEWCQDWMGDYPSSHVTGPAGPSSGSYRVSRGGGLDSYAHHCRSAFRNCFSPGDRYGFLGFRLLRTP